MNLNSTMRTFIPFGARGTVVGKTEEKLIIHFDDQFLHGSNIYGHSQKYRGFQMKPDHLLNLSRQFARMMKENYQAAKRFMEKPLEGYPAYAGDLQPKDDVKEAAVQRKQILDKRASEQKEEKPV